MMRDRSLKISFALLTGLVFLAGCATTRPRKPDPTADLQNQVSQLQNEVQAKDQQIQELQAQLESKGSIRGTPNFTSGDRSNGSSIIRVADVSVTDVQKALARAGFDPGPADGRAGKKTKLAIKHFQAKHGLPADGIVGKKTWVLLNR